MSKTAWAFGAVLALLVLFWLWRRNAVSEFTPAPPPEPSVADEAVAAPQMAAPPEMYQASSPESVADVVLMNPNVPVPPPVTSSTPLPPVPDFRPVIQQPPVIPRVDSTMTVEVSQNIKQPPAILQTPPMTQGLAPISMDSVVGFRL